MTPPARRRPGLLVSVRSALEARAALAGGADLIDVKEPLHGSLGRAADNTIRAVLAQVAGCCPVSAALGELVQELPTCRDERLRFVKWGLAGCAPSRPPSFTNWQSRLARELSRPGNPQTVLVAYADWRRAAAPALDLVVAMACRKAGNVLLIDTYCKEMRSDGRRPTLLDWSSVDEIRALCASCRAAGVRVALAGSLGFGEIERLRCADPDWFAVRGAVCKEQDRVGMVNENRVRSLVALVSGEWWGAASQIKKESWEAPTSS